ncbi:non-ribosomal peptide synthetase [Nocardioides sp. Kera G14]|uniref:non-ribosomal peptide synthetase n=1 Tax=Nocardioides sp. Kera G14 TaxID=2884264 RepID=UPI001D12FF97|nr:non-ribosomal peptide synthetase [Nocardioides sp. Kera G14]UDY24268.1 amino acid adenylation domain-containing protein [Nocardioides sp. Kera G14]
MPDRLPLTAAQRGLFFAHQLDPSNPCYTTAEVVEFSGRLDAERLAAAVSGAYAEFEQLRVELTLTPEGPQQQVRAAGPVEVPVVECASVELAEEWMRTELARPLDLLGGELTRTALLRLPETDWWFHAAHHVVLDGYGVQQLFRRVAELYGGAEVGPVRATLADVIATEAVTDDPAAREFWEGRLGTFEGPASLAGHAAAPSAASLRRAVDVPQEVQDALVTGAKRLGVAWADLFTAAVGSYLARMAAQSSIRVGLPLMNRVRPGVGALPAAHTVCTAMNVLPITVPVAGTVAETLDAVREEQAAIRAHPWVRQEELARSLGARGQLFGAQVNVIPFDLELRFDDVTGVVRNLTAGPVEDVTVGLRGVPGRGRSVRLEIDANPALYPADELEGHVVRLLAWLGIWAEATAEDRVGDLALLTDHERELVVHTFNDTSHPREFSTLGRRFTEAVTAHPDAVALRFGGETRTYRELDHRARLIAGALADKGIRPGETVGVSLERSIGLYETIHAIALLGAVYLPIDPELPEDRIAMMLEDADTAVVIDDVGAWLGSEPFLGVHDEIDSSAYLLFTSGSTGRPKGVLISHRAIDNRLAWMQHHLPIGEGDVVLHKTPISFDVSVWELYWPLQVGACVEIAPPGAHRDPRALAPLLAVADVVHFVPSMLRALLSDRTAREQIRAVGGVRHVVTSGEALTPDLVAESQHWLGNAPTNLYGPTEAAVDVTVWDTAVGEDVVPIGRPIWNTTCFVLDTGGRPVPVGAVGELWLGGVQLADGYVGRPELTAERFVASEEFGRIYRTGDLAAWRPDGSLRYLGRTDDQVKVRGQRVELGEIEAVVSGIVGVDGAVAGVVDGMLACWYVSSEGDGDDVAALRQAISATLPAAWVPSHLIRVETIPVGSSGKADRQTLARRHPPTAAAGNGAGSFLEQRLAELVAGILGLASVPTDADFFDLGGDSLKVLQLLGALEVEWGVELGLADVFDAPTAAGLAPAVTAALEGAGTRRDDFAELLTLRRGAPDRAPLFLLPPAGGLGWCYTALLRHLPAELPVHTIQAPAMGEGRPEPVDSLTALAARQLAAIRSVVGDGPFDVAGWSLGGMAAHAVAALARGEGQEVGAVVLLDAYPPEQWGELADPTEEDALLGLLRLGAAVLPEGVALTRSSVAAALRDSGSALAALPEKIVDGCIASVLEAARLVRTPVPARLPGDATLVVATAPRPETWLDPSGWDALVGGAVHRAEVAATHGELVRHPDVAKLLASLVGQ